MKLSWRIALCLFIGSSVFAKKPISVASVDDEVLCSVYDLEAQTILIQNQFLPISPPSEEVYVHLEKSVLPVDWKKFPKAFTKQMYAEMDDNGYPIYRVAVYEDPVTRQMVFLNSYGMEVYRLEAEKGYDPYAWQKEFFQLKKGEILDDWSRWLYDPAKIAAEFALIPEVFYSDYLADQRIQAVQKTLKASKKGVMSKSGGTSSGLHGIIGITTNGMVELELRWPMSFTNQLEIFTSTNLVERGWEVACSGISTFGATNFFWEDTGFTNLSQQFYIVGNADLDSDLDELSNAREIIIHNTDPQLRDTDKDGIWDGWEVSHGLNPKDGSDTFLDLDGDGIPNYVEFMFENDSQLSGKQISICVHVGTNDVGGIQGAINAALSGAGTGFPVVMIEPGIYSGSTNRNLTITNSIAVFGMPKVIMDCEGLDRGFHLEAGDWVLLNGIDIVNANHDTGAGIYAEVGLTNLIVKNMAFQNCTSSNGCIIEINPMDGVASIHNVEITDCVDSVSAIVALNFGGLQLTDSIFKNCDQFDYIIVTPRLIPTGNIVLSRIKIEGCSVNETILYIQNNSVFLENSLVCDCKSRGGIFCTYNCPLLVISHSTLANNQSDSAAWGYFGDSNSYINIEHSIFWNNATTIISKYYGSGVVGITNSCIEGGWDGGLNNTSNFPGIRTDGHLIGANSIAIDYSITSTNRVDIDGEHRDSIPDMGADEWIDRDQDNMADALELLGFGDLNNNGSGSSDSDLLTDYQEFVLGTDPMDDDTDDDGLSDYDEDSWFNPSGIGSNPLLADTDGDGLYDGGEYQYRNDSLAPLDLINAFSVEMTFDTDKDGMTNAYELAYRDILDPFDPADGVWDTDGDGLLNSNECLLGTSIILPDTDHDGFTDGDEYEHGMNPVEQAVPGSADWEDDADGDGLSNGFELQNLLNPFFRQDSDFDGLWDDQEIINGTDRYDADSDNDGFTDGKEFCWGYTSSLTNEGFYAVDTDGDGLPGWQELAYYTNPTNSDTDADGFDDGQEVYWGSDPTNVASFLISAEGTIVSGNILSGAFLVYAESGENQYWGSVSNHLFSVTNIPNLLTYSVSVFRDSNSNTVQDAWEEFGSTNLQLDVSISGVAITTVIPDDDEDGLPDWWEYTQCGGDIDPNGDEDTDGVSNYMEYAGGTNPLEPDSDRDGVFDSTEIDAGTSATNAASTASLIRGFVRNDSGTTGTIYVLAASSSNGWSTAQQETVSTDGGYTVEGLSPGSAYYLRAFIDTNESESLDAGESWADYAGNAVMPLLIQNNINIFIGTPLLSGDGDGDGVEDFVELLQGRDIHIGAVLDINRATQLDIYQPRLGE